jgi:hypothetical protein
MSEYKWSWKRAGRVVKAISENRMLITLVIANVLTLLISAGWLNYTEADVENISVAAVSTVLLIVNSIAALIGKILEARREPESETKIENPAGNGAGAHEANVTDVDPSI